MSKYAFNWDLSHCFQIASLGDLRKKWHIPPAFSVEFIGYYLDRVSRLQEGKANLQEQIDTNIALATEQRTIRAKYDEVSFFGKDYCRAIKTNVHESQISHADNGATGSANSPQIRIGR